MSHTAPFVQILMAAYNSQKYIEEQLISILNQTACTFQIIISDDCSTDQTLEIIERISQQYPGVIKTLTSHVNQGIFGNFAKLMQYADAHYIMFSDADDVWLPHKISHTLSKMHALERQYGVEKPLLVYTDLTVVDKNLQIIDTSFWHYSHLRPRYHTTLNRQMRQNIITGCTMLINRALLELARPLPNGIIMHDWWLGLVTMTFGHLDFIDQPTMLYRQHGNNDVGAQPYGLKGYLKYIKRQPKKSANTFTQAQVFLDRYRTTLTQQQSTAILAYLKLQKSHLIYRFYLMIKYGFYKHGFLRNILTI